MTVHSAKGLEFRSVFITGMEEEIFPYSRVSHEEPEEIDEERRLAYVAITRARERLWIVHAGMRTLFGRALFRLRQEGLETFSRKMWHRVARQIADCNRRSRMARTPTGDKFVCQHRRLAGIGKQTGIHLQQIGVHLALLND
jgi:ATP-dependent exoDNAse (exonuclease V) alpha subunit